MSDLITDDLVEMVARAIKAVQGNHWTGPIPRYDPDALLARAALAVAIPVIGERCAAEDDEVARSAFGRDPMEIGTRLGAENVTLRIRSLTNPEAGDG
jgi:hypothetical protein